MEEGIGSRRARALPRPESSASSNTRMTPSSSNSSTAHLPQRVQDLSARGASGSLLQDRLRERKVESARQRRRSIDLSMERGIQSSPVKSNREDRRPSSSGIVAGKNMGVKQIEDAVSTLHKQNFDLKLELYHRRQRQEALEARLEELERKIDQQAEWKEMNEELMAELDKKDQAINEAVTLICTLEDKVDRLERERNHVKAFDEQGYFPSQDFSSSPPQFDKDIPALPKKISRMPSFMSETTEGNEALRSLYLPYNGHSDSTLPKLSEEAQDGLDSPRLSILSESSFVSVYGNKQPPQMSLDEEEVPRRHRSASLVEKWVDERPPPVVTPPRVVPSLRKSQFLSINDVLESPLQRLEKLQQKIEKTEKGLNAAKDHATLQDKRRSREIRHVSTDKKFERQHNLPPTPDTISTNTLRNYRNSNDTLHQDNARAEYSRSGFHANNAFQSTISLRPRSAGETVTSRREGHGWDTPQEDTTETGSASSTLSTYSTRYTRQKQSVAPDLFTFGGGDWGHDYTEPVLPAHPASRYQSLRRSSMVEHPQSDDTVMNYSRYDNSPQYGTTPIDTTPKPEFPDRRSSLSAVTKLRNAKPKPQQETAKESPSSKENKKSRIPNIRMFGRGESAPPASPTKTFSPSLPRPKAVNRSSGYFSNENAHGLYDEEERATPPPIMRSRPGQSFRPASTSAAGPPKRNGTFVGGYDGAGDEPQGQSKRDSFTAPVNMEVGRNGEEQASKSKKWFGLGRSNSLKKN